MEAANDVTAIVLCGGSGSRFQGADKPLLTLRDRPMLAHVLERLRPQVASVVLSANRNPEAYARFGHPVVPDRLTDGGPLAGLSSALAVTEHDLLFLCPGDAPLLATDLVQRLQNRMADGVDAVVPHDGRRAQHLFMLVRRRAAEAATDYLARGGRSVAGFLEARKVTVVPVADGVTFTNVNTPADLVAAAQRLEKGWRSPPE